MLTRPVKGFLLSLLSATVVVAPLAVTVPAHANGCLLPGAGTEADPWLVDSQADFQLVGSSPTGCTATGHYRQTADLTLNDPVNDAVGGTLTGTYDGDHYSINMESWEATSGSTPFYLFQAIGDGGEVRKVRLSGSISLSGTATAASPLAFEIQAGGVVSEVHSSVDISSSSNDTVNIGGIALRLHEGARLQYSSYTGSIAWTPPQNPLNQGWIGGLVGVFRDSSGGEWAEIRDSYSTGSIEAPNMSNLLLKPIVGGLVGQIPGTAEGRIIRSYAASEVSYSNNPGTPSSTFVGGLVGRQQSSSSDLQLVSSFWLESATVERAVGGNNQPADVITDDFLSSDPYLAVAPGVDSTELATLTTFISQEASPAGSGNPGGTEIPVLASDRSGTPSAPDYRWAIEAGDVSVFIPSLYDDLDANTSSDEFESTNRNLYDDTSVARSYQTRGSNLEGTVTGYPTLGRVWEICSQENSGFPVLVWEERCGDGQGGGSSGGAQPSSRDDDDDEVPVVAEAPTLAATGPSVLTGQVALVAIVLLLGLGVVLVTRQRKADVRG